MAIEESLTARPDGSARSGLDLAVAKAVVLDHYAILDRAVADVGPTGEGPTDDRLIESMGPSVGEGYRWRGVHPFDEQPGIDGAVSAFWGPLARSFTALQRRPDVFLAGRNDVDGGLTTWVCQMGHLVGLFDRPWLDIPPTNRMTFLRYAEFHRVDPDGPAGPCIAETALFVDVVAVMRQAGHYPLPPATGAMFIHPGPQTHDGLLIDPQPEAEGVATLDLVNAMVSDLAQANELALAGGGDHMDPEVLARTWHDDMIWYGPDGIGATYTIGRYQHQHQYPFRFNLADKVFNGHVARFGEGHYAGFFGWPNLTNRPTGGMLGLPASGPADMRVVDIYRRSGDKLAENWVFIDLLHWLSMQGLDVLARMRQLLGTEKEGHW